MSIFYRVSLLIAVLCSIAGNSLALELPTDQPANSIQQQEFLPVSKAFPFKFSISDKVIQIHWQTTPGYYLYADSMQLGELSKPELKLLPKFNKDAHIKYDPNFEKDMAIFEGELIANFRLDQPVKQAFIRFQGCAEAGLCYPMQEIRLDELLSNVKSINIKNSPAMFSNDYLHTLLNDASLFKIIVIFLLLGIGLCLTPCVLPMMPIISSLVLGREKPLSKFQAFAISTSYVMSMTLTYTLAGILAASLGARANIQIWMQEPWVLGFFALLFVVLALSMFNVYELKLPQALNNKLTALSNRQQGGDYIGATIMGVLSALVVSPCISAPLAGALVFISTTGDVLIGGSALFALGFGMGLPLIVLCTFGIHLLPKSGEWLNYSKRFFGLLLIGVAIWMLSRFLNPSVTLALWGALLILASFCFGSWRTADALGKTILMIILLWGVMMIIGAALGNSNPLQPLANLKDGYATQNAAHKSRLDFHTITSLDGLAQAKTDNQNSGKLLLLDFYADWCTSCKEVEQEIFENAQFDNFLKNNFLVRADLSNNSIENFELLEALNLFGPPAILFYDDQGNELKALRIQGTISSRNFQSLLDKHLPQH